jgi:hypothetical protein
VSQGDQIGRSFAYWVFDYFGQCFETKTFGLLFYTVRDLYYFWHKNGLANIFGDFLQTHPVTLTVTEGM